MRKFLWATGVVLLLATAALLWSLRSDDSEAVRTAFREYDAACRNGDLAAVKTRVTGARAEELSRPVEGLAFAGAGRARPTLARIASCNVSGSKATLKLRGAQDGARAAGTATLVRDSDVWRVATEDWKVIAASLPTPPPDEDLAPAVRPLIDRIASDDPMDACKAWLELGTRYQNAAAFLAEVKPALWDRRPVHFEITEGTANAGGRTLRYFTAKTPAEQGPTVPADTVGEALRYHLWQYEDVSGTGFKGTFDEWWDTWAPSRALPGGAP